MRWPAPASQPVSGTRSPMSPAPQLVEDGQEDSGMSKPDWRRPAGSLMAADRAIEALQNAIGSFGELRLGNEQAHDQVKLARKTEEEPGMRQHAVILQEIDDEGLFRFEKRHVEKCRPAALAFEDAARWRRSRLLPKALVIRSEEH